MRKAFVPVLGMITCGGYFVAVLIFLLTKTDIALTIWEISTIAGAIVVTIVLVKLNELLRTERFNKMLSQIFLSCTCCLTGAAHVINIFVTRKLISDGVDVPTYFRIGCWPSAEMAVDYLAWGLFMGMAFLSVGFGVKSVNKKISHIKRSVITCGILCIIGFLGAFFINENIWYLAPIGYGIGSFVICCQMLG